MKKFLIITTTFFAFSLLWNVVAAQAATLYLVPDAQNFGASQEFTVDIKTNTENVSINAAQATVQFPVNILTLLEIEKGGSIFNFWAEEPVISDEAGTLKFIGGATKGVSGSALQILRMKFKASGLGKAELTFSDAAVVAADGKGTNVLSQMTGATYVVSAEMVQPEAPEPPEPEIIQEPEGPAPEPEPEPVEQPKPVVREPVIAQNLPQEPVLTVPLYSDSSKWYNHLAEVIVFWEVPDDVVKIGARIDQDPNGSIWNAENIETVLFTGKKFDVLEEGVWYAHVQFKNNIGWSEIAHYKISIDTTPPLPFEIGIDNKVSDNPLPKITYETYDSLSGIAEYLIFVDGKKLPVLTPQGPGEHTIKVRAIDLAGNSVEDDLEFEVLPLPTPTIDFITRSVSQGEFIFASGKTISNGFADVHVLNKAGSVVFSGESSSDELGNWEITIEEPLARGVYTLRATARDSRGAVSYPTEAETLKIKAKTIVSVGFIELGWFEIFLIILLLVISGVSMTAWYYVSLQKRRAAYKMVAARDIDKLTKLLAEDLEGLGDWVEKSKEGFEKRAIPEMEFHLNNMRQTISRMRKYLRQELDKLK